MLKGFCTWGAGIALPRRWCILISSSGLVFHCFTLCTVLRKICLLHCCICDFDTVCMCVMWHTHVTLTTDPWSWQPESQLHTSLCFKTEWLNLLLYYLCLMPLFKYFWDNFCIMPLSEFSDFWKQICQSLARILQPLSLNYWKYWQTFSLLCFCIVISYIIDLNYLNFAF